MRRTSALTAAAVLTLSGGLAACGSSSGSSAPAAPTNVLAAAYSSSVAAKTVDVSMSVKTAAAGKAVTVTGTGQVDWGARTAEIHLAIQAPGSATTVSFAEIVTKTAVYGQFPPQVAQKIGLTKPWVEIPVNTTGANTPNPADTLQLLISESTSVTKVGPATIDGVATTEYKADIDPAKEASNLSSTLQADFTQSAGQAGITSIPVVAYLDSSGKPVQIATTVTVTAPAGSGSASTPQSVTLTEQTDFSHWGTPVTITPPPASEVGTSSQLSSLFGSSPS